MYRARAWMLTIVVGCVGTSLGASPATPSYRGVEQSIARIREEWFKPGAQAGPNLTGWNSFFDALTRDLNAYATAPTEDDRLRALDRLYQMSVALHGVTWSPATELRESIRDWLRPRVGLAWAIRQLTTSVQTLPATGDSAALSNRQRWIQFVDNELGKAIRDYEAAQSVASRLASLRRLNAALEGLQERNRARPWSPALALQTAILDLYDRPNIDAAADVATLSRRLAHDVAITGPIFRRGMWSYVTAGPKSGFGLLPCDDGIAFFNRQRLTSVTPITTFNQQVASDRKGQRIAKLYHFNATSYDAAEMTVTAILRPSGLALMPASTHATNAAVTAVPIPGKEFGRCLAGVLGFDRQRITQQVREGAIGKIREGVIQGSAEESKERVGVAQAQQNARLASFLIGNDTFVYENIEVRDLALRSRPENALIGGKLEWRGAGQQIGADAPKPPSLSQPAAGITADIHLGSLMTNLTRGYLQSDAAKDVENLMIVTQKIPPGGRPRDAIATSTNVDFATFARAVEETRAAKDPRILAIRVKRPGTAPEFAADRNGFLIAVVHDFAIEVPAPPQAARGGLAGPPARIYRISAPDAEFAISFRVEEASENLPIRLQGRIEGFDAGPGAKVFAIDQDDTKATQLTTFTANLVLVGLGIKIKGQPIDVPLGNLAIPGFTLTRVSKLDPSGWLRVVLAPNR